MTSDDVLIRPATLEDRSFIIDSWLHSYRGSEFGRRIPDDVWWARWGQAGFVETCVDSLEGANTATAVACLPSDPGFIFGFAVCGLASNYDQVLHFLYVKKDYRKNGVGKRLIDAGFAYDIRSPLLVTAETPAWKGFAAKHGIAYEYRHPYRKDR